MFPAFRARRAAFWYLAPDRIVAAVIARAEREPVLEACAASYSRPVAGSCFAPGVVEVSWVLGCERRVQVAALAASFCRVGALDDAAAEAVAVEEDVIRAGERRGTVSGAQGVAVWAEEAAVAQAAGLFSRARLQLVALDCEPCALASLAEALGTADTEAARRQHLSAVAVLPECESAAEALGEDLAIPVGLAVAWFGAGRAR